MNSDEYHAPNVDDAHPDTCRFCGVAWREHEHSCPQPKDDDPVYTQLKEPSLWQETP